MAPYTLDNEDLAYLEAQGISPKEIFWQLEILRRDAAFVRLVRPCRIDDGIFRLTPAQMEICLVAHEKAAKGGRFLKFVPASGAATRMFQGLHEALARPEAELKAICQAAEEHGAGAPAVPAQFAGLVQFIGGRRRLAFHDRWNAACCERLGRPLEALLAAGAYHAALRVLLTPEGLGYGAYPKALIPFHCYGDEPRTPIEEHLVEAAATVRDEQGRCRLHFTLGSSSEAAVRELAEAVRRVWQERLGCDFELSYSLQQRATDTLAVDFDNRPLRDSSGRLLLRPSGHGALLENLNALQADLIYIKNIDNVAADYLEAVTVFWKKLLGGLLANLQDQVHHLVRQLEAEPNDSALAAARRFCEQWLRPAPPGEFADLSAADQAHRLLERLRRPLRVCGVVPTTGEPGGGPFWVQGRDGSVSLQIVEQAQVRMNDPEQATIWRQSTHFNPVDLVCGVRDAHGERFDLTRYRDPDAVFITRKSDHGRPLKALERPGLWNGAMAFWNTVFVEVPRLTFNPVKTVNDLLRPEHQPAADDGGRLPAATTRHPR